MNNTSYHPPPLLGNGHVQTIFPVLFRTVSDVIYTRERISTWDNDFLDLDWSCRGSDRLAAEFLDHEKGNCDAFYSL